jgi:hypothetical protein
MRINSLNLPPTQVFAGVAIFVCITDFTLSLLNHYAFGIEVIGYTVQSTVDNLCVCIQIICLKGGCLYSSPKSQFDYPIMTSNFFGAVFYQNKEF